MTKKKRIEIMTNLCRTVPKSVAGYIVRTEDEVMELKIRLGVKDIVITRLAEKLELMQARISGVLEDI